MGKNDDVIIKIATMLIKRTFEDSEKSKKLDSMYQNTIYTNASFYKKN